METPRQTELLPRLLSGSQAKTAFALRQNCERMVSDAGVNAIGFLTLTVGQLVSKPTLFGPESHFEQVRDASEASRRINNLNRRVLKEVFERAVIVTERHKSGAIHFHALGVLNGRPDIRTGFNFERFYELQADVRTRRRRAWRAEEVGASPELRGLWATLRRRLPDYGFGRAELTPIRRTGEAVASYVSKYIEKNVCNRLPEDRHKKLVRYIGDWSRIVPAERPDGFRARFLLTREAHKREEPVVIFGDMPAGELGGVCKLRPNDFGWSGAKAVAWWAKTGALARMAGIEHMSEAKEAFGPRWAWHLDEVWKRGLGDDMSPGLVAGFRERQTLRNELAKRSTWQWRVKLRQAEAAAAFWRDYLAGISQAEPDSATESSPQPPEFFRSGPLVITTAFAPSLPASERSFVTARAWQESQVQPYAVADTVPTGAALVGAVNST